MAQPEQFERYRPLMLSIAYRMLGSATEAEDIVQEAYLRYQAAEKIQSPKAFLSTIVTRLCLDQLKSAKAQRETYIGPWLPEPVLTDGAALMPERQLTEYDSISMAFLVLLESLTPLERAVFLLREVFDYEYGKIAQIVGKEEAACRQLFSRAKKHVAEHRPRFQSSPEEHSEIVARFLKAVGDGDLDGLMSLLTEDVGWWSDGGGKTRAALRPLYGRDKVARYILGLRRFVLENTTTEIAQVNGKPAVILRADGKPYSVMLFEIGNGKIRQVRSVVNPDKLKHV